MPYSNMTFTVSTGLAFVVNDFVQVSHDADNYIVGRVVSYNSGTGALVITPLDFKGSGTYNTWTVSLTGYNGTAGTAGTSSVSDSSGTAGTSGTAATAGTAGESDSSGTSGTTGTSGSSATSGQSQPTGTSGTSGTSAASGTSATAGTSASSGTSTNSGTSGTAATSGSSGTSGSFGVSGTSGSSASSGTSGTSGSSGSSGVNGATGPQGPTGPPGPPGATGTSGSSGVNGGQGPQGAAGPGGLQGFQGAQGPIGGQGPTGAQGGPGGTGPTGPQGPANSNNQTLNVSSPATFNSVSTGEWYSNFRFYCGPTRGLVGPSPRFTGYGPGWYTFTSIGSVYFFNPSTKEMKKNIQPFVASALDIIDSTEIVTYNYELDGQEDSTRIGFIAEDTPVELSTKTHDKMDYNSTMGVLMKAIQELDAKLKIKEEHYK